MGLFQRLLGPGNRKCTPEISLLKEQLAADITLFSSIRGRVALLRPGAAVIMNHLYETFLTKDVSTIADRRGIVAVVKLQDLRSLDQVRFIRGEDLRGPAGTAVVHSLATQAATELLRQAAGETYPALADSRPAERSAHASPPDH